MTNYLLSIDPSIKNTGFTLWEKTKRISECEVDYREIEYIYKWKPIWINSYSFEKFKNINPTFDEQIIVELFIIGKIKHFDNMNIIIERGTFHSKNGIGYETQEHLRGFIAGQFNKLLTKNMLISPSSWKKWYINNLKDNYNLPKKQEFIWIKNTWIQLANELINEQNWNITISKSWWSR